MSEFNQRCKVSRFRKLVFSTAVRPDCPISEAPSFTDRWVPGWSACSACSAVQRWYHSEPGASEASKPCVCERKDSHKQNHYNRIIWEFLKSFAPVVPSLQWVEMWRSSGRDHWSSAISTRSHYRKQHDKMTSTLTLTRLVKLWLFQFDFLVLVLAFWIFKYLLNGSSLTLPLTDADSRATGWSCGWKSGEEDEAQRFLSVEEEPGFKKPWNQRL